MSYRPREGRPAEPRRRSPRPLARCDCAEGHWLARVAIHDGEPCIEYRTAVVGVTRSGNYTSSTGSRLAWEPLAQLRAEMADGLESFTVNGRCPRDRNYRLDLVELARRIGQPTVILTAQHADRIDIRPFRADMD